MDPERVPARPQSEVTPPVHAFGEDRSRIIQPDPFNPPHPNIPQTTARVDANLIPSTGRLLPSTSSEKSVVDDTLSLHHPSNIHDHLAQPILQSPLSAHLAESNPARRETRIISNNRFSTEEKEAGRHTVGERLQPTLDIAIVEKDKYAAKAKWTGYTLNAAIGLQVLLGSLTTGLSALAVSGKSTAKSTTALGALATLVASYLARARGSNEPELSITRTKDLEQFIRECRAFQMDHGHVIGNDFNEDIIGFRRRFEELLGNANGERKLAPPV